MNVVEASTSFTKVAMAFLLAASLVGTIAVKGVGYAADIESIKEIQDKQSDNIAAIEDIKATQEVIVLNQAQNAEDMKVLMSVMERFSSWLDNPTAPSN